MAREQSRWRRWSGCGVWREFCWRPWRDKGAVEDLGFLDSTYVKAQRSAQGAQRVQVQAIGVSRGEQTIRMNAVCDLLGRPVALALTPGNRSDGRAVEALIDATYRFKRLAADRAYDSD